MSSLSPDLWAPFTFSPPLLGSVGLLCPPQNFRQEPLHHLATYLCLSLVVAELVLSCLVDQPPFFSEDSQPLVSQSWRPLTPDPSNAHDSA